MKKIFSAFAVYRRVVRWNGESVSELYEYLKSVMLTLPYFVMQPLPVIFGFLKRNSSMRFDMSRVSEPILAIDKRGFALIGGVKGFHVVQLRTIDDRDRTYEIAPPTVSVRWRKMH